MEILIPFLVCRLIELSAGRLKALTGLVHDLLFASSFALLYSWFPCLALRLLWIPLVLYRLLAWYLDFAFHIPLTPKLWRFALHFRPFIDSAKAVQLPYTAAIGFLLVAASYQGFHHPFPLWLFFASGALSLLFLKRPSQKSNAQELTFPNELSAKIDPHFPVLRKTHAFLGRKRFDIPVGKPHVVFLILESFRAKETGSSLTPHFNGLAKQSLHFTQFHSLSNLTACCSVASLFGIPPRQGMLGEYAKLGLRSLPQMLPGYHAALIQGGPVSFDHGPAFFQKNGFQTLIGRKEIEQKLGPVSHSSWGLHDEHLMQFAAPWLDQQTQPTFLALYTITNHHPWTPPPHWKAEGSPFLQTLAYTDWALGLFFQKLKHPENCIFFIFGDHGQESGTSHFEINRNLTQENLHVPLLIYAPGRIKEPKTFDFPCSQIDLLPTVLDLFQLPGPHHGFGQSLLREAPPSPLYFSHPLDESLRGCREGKWKLILDGEKKQLFDLAADPSEQTNLALAQPEITQELAQKTDAFHASVSALYEKNAFAPPTPEIPSERHFETDALDFDDKALLSLSPQISSLSLSECLLLTDAGFQALPSLEKLSLRGLDEVEGIGWPTLPYLFHLKISDCPRFKGTLFPALRILEIEGDCELELLFSGLWAVQLKRMNDLTDQALQALLERNPHLTTVAIEDCPLIGDAPFASLDGKVLCQLSLAGLPRLTDRGLEALRSWPIEQLALRDCPNITYAGLKNLNAGRIYLFNCPQVETQDPRIVHVEPDLLSALHHLQNS